jgi:hypothetical protein
MHVLGGDGKRKERTVGNIRVLLALIATAGISIGSAQPGEWTQLWYGRDLRGWEHIGYGRFVVDDGVLKTDGVDRTLGLLYYKEKVGNCVLRIVYKEIGERSNSGLA